MVRSSVTCIIVLAALVAVAFGSTGKTLTGKVTDTDSQPLVGASVVVYADGSPVAGSPTDSHGRFKLTLSNTYRVIHVRVSSIGYQEHEQNVALADSITTVNIACSAVMVEVPPITVRPEKESYLQKISMPKDRINNLASRSLVVTNPVAALQYPQLAKIGSNHSSQIRVNGTTPNYFLNGISIGSDPNHYGMFSVIPATILHQIDFQPQGTDASYGLPSIINFMSPTSFERASQTDINLSTLEATATFRRSSESKYLVGSARKSILDALMNSFDVNTERSTIPPTSFSDIYLSTGLKLSERYQLGLDQYHVYDYLAFNTASTTAAAAGVQTYQRARENYFGLRATAMYSNLLLNATLAVRDGSRSYEASPEEGDGGIRIQLAERQRTYLGNLNADLALGSWDVKLGNQFSYVADRETELEQQNWNFLPPFATSDNPYIYQNALNRTYGEYAGSLSQLNNATYLSASRTFGRLRLLGGLRSEYYGHLASSEPFLVRMSANFRTGEKSNVEFFYGTFSEDPIAAVLESYQVMIRDYASELAPISTELVSLDYTIGPWKAGIFTKQLSQLPVISPDFDRPYISNRGVNGEFLRMRSEGTANFYGGSLTFDDRQFLLPRLSWYASYAYTRGTKTEHGVTYPHEATAPHRFVSQLEYKLSKKVTIGSDMQVRSGYNYTPTRSTQWWYEPSLYNEAYYTKMLGRENSDQFASNMTLNLYARFDFGSTSLHLAITNATNRFNQIIKAPSGYVYDAGILPSIGFNWKL